MPPLSNVRASIGSYSNSKYTNTHLNTPNETGERSEKVSAYAPSINMKSIMKQSVFSPLENQRKGINTKGSMDHKKVQIFENDHNR